MQTKQLSVRPPLSLVRRSLFGALLSAATMAALVEQQCIWICALLQIVLSSLAMPSKAYNTVRVKPNVTNQTVRSFSRLFAGRFSFIFFLAFFFCSCSALAFAHARSENSREDIWCWELLLGFGSMPSNTQLRTGTAAHTKQLFYGLIAHETWARRSHIELNTHFFLL